MTVLIDQPLWIQAPLVVGAAVLICALVALVLSVIVWLVIPPSDMEKTKGVSR